MNDSVLQPFLVHTGQHYDKTMSDVFFHELGIPEPNVNLAVGSGTHSTQTAKVMVEFEKIVLKNNFDLILVVGDVNSTMACALVGAKLNIPVAHVEAGIRSFDRTMPEEINRIVTDAVSNYLFAPTSQAVENLKTEGISDDKIFLVGNVMIDSLYHQKKIAEETDILARVGVHSKQYALMTMHRPSNVDQKETLEGIIEAVAKIQKQICIIFPVHPRTQSSLKKFGLNDKLDSLKNLIKLEPLGYLPFLKLMNHAKFILTDSGGIQEESAALNVPCMTMRANTERPEMVEYGSSVLVNNKPKKIITEMQKIMSGQFRDAKLPESWDGKSSTRITKIIESVCL